MKMKPQYDLIKNIFIQSSLTDFVMGQQVKNLNKGFIMNGELRYWFWRYIYMKDLSKETLTNRLLKAGFDNLTIVEIINALNFNKSVVKEIIANEKKA